MKHAKTNLIKLNVGASPIWSREGWHTLDHKIRDQSSTSLLGDAANIPLSEGSCDVIFCSHMFEHIPHTRLEKILIEFNRVLSKGGVVRILSPNLFRIAKAYVERDKKFFEDALQEDENLRTDLGFGGMFLNCVVSPGQDTALFNRQLNEFIGGYAHLYLYDFEMMKILFERCGFEDVTEKKFCDSAVPELCEPLHVVGRSPVWENFNKQFYQKNNLVHHYDSKDGKYHINFRVTGFDRDPLTSLIVEARKKETISLEQSKQTANHGRNYNHYGQSLLSDKKFNLKVRLMQEISNAVDHGLPGA